MNVKTINILIFEDADALEDQTLWIAQGLEYDIAAQGTSLKEVQERFAHTLIAQSLVDLRQGKDVFEGIPSAPRTYWEQFDEGFRLGWKQPRSINLSEYELIWPSDEHPLKDAQTDEPDFFPSVSEARICA